MALRVKARSFKCALLSVDYSNGPAVFYLLAVREYMPIGHRAFVNDIEKQSRVRHRIDSGGQALLKAYNAVLKEIAVFRKIYLRLTHDYMFVPSGMAESEKGTGVLMRLIFSIALEWMPSR